jgi:hypothetical protein
MPEAAAYRDRDGLSRTADEARIAVALFTVAFSFCLLVVACFDAPFEVVLRHEPEKTMREALEKL